VTAASLREVSDGLSQTALLVESSGLPSGYKMGEELEYSFPMLGPWMSVETAYVGIGGPLNESPINHSNSSGIYSFHRGGAHVVMCDGSVHFLSDHLGNQVVGALLTREGGEPIIDKAWQ
jgi:prepilin-type processing-associated H-X9-DG protein